MNKYEKSAYEIMKRGDRIIAEKKRKTVIMRRSAFAVSGLCAATIIGFGIWNSSPLRESLDRDRVSHISIIEATTDNSSLAVTDVTSESVNIKTTSLATTSERTTSALRSTDISIMTTEAVVTSQTAVADITTKPTAIPEHPVVPDTGVSGDPGVNAFYKFTDTESGICYTAWNEKLSPQLISRLIKKITLCEQANNTDMEIISDSELYAIKGISPEAMIGVRHEGQKDIMIYHNIYYSPKTLGDFIDSCGFREYATFTSADYYDFNNGYRYLNYYGFDDSLIWETLFADTDIRSVNIHELLPDQIVHKMTLVYEMQGLLSFKIGFGISEKGYITTNLVDSGIAFYIGEEKAAQFIELITENYPYDVIGDIGGEDTSAIPDGLCSPDERECF